MPAEILPSMILFVCTGNTCRSPMAEALLRHHLDARGRGAGDRARHVLSVGTLGWNGHPATTKAVEVMRERGIDLSAHISRRMDRRDVEAADVIIAMTRKHAWAVAAHDEAAYERTFLLGELLRAADGWRPGADLRSWAVNIGKLRGDRPIGHAQDEIDDPAGEPIEVYRATADLLEASLAALADALG